MKKLLTITTIILLAFAFLLGCGKDVPPTQKTGALSLSLYRNVSDGGLQLPLEEDTITVKETKFWDLKAKVKTHITFAGQNFFVQYEESVSSSSGKHHDYVTAKGDFITTNDDGTVISLFSGECHDPEVNARSLSQEECVQIAIDIMNTLTNAEEYTMTVEPSDDQSYYKIVFEKLLDGFKTNERASFRIEKSGHIYSFSSSALGSIQAGADTGFQRDEVEKKVTEALDQFCTSLMKSDPNQYPDVRYKNVTYVLFVDDTNTYAVNATAVIELRTPFVQNTYAVTSELVTIKIR